jgi:hypothetical protein
MRRDTTAPIAISWKDASGREQSAFARVTNLSATGACLESARPIQVGKPVSCRFQDQNRAGMVKHSVIRGSGYVLGVEFDVEVPLPRR